ncbi:radical S-adenosyl methionine domain-containing protein 1, mitochondrial-like [Patiria miniata]|uniref:Radical S-adenosyl methionine domain-containing protein 1, mitochondrial n=1 Tax=Patiria miniata TaxID=46514 RepID=A0A914AFL7_PATMI|nr:radical S-adenosyl methionine domain-containing protein 1, mitochondrial-like [Patiria miniata]XP_038062294.1 radical S-adenosyl methionine domain-containing protein 1, mitochondrial-like [Patiria miniata]XP_038062296.1 radical S-adenosyl methionine domain-containing protein 1, mitochondrial-like [Patiria miniata]
MFFIIANHLKQKQDFHRVNCFTSKKMKFLVSRITHAWRSQRLSDYVKSNVPPLHVLTSANKTARNICSTCRKVQSCPPTVKQQLHLSSSVVQPAPVDTTSPELDHQPSTAWMDEATLYVHWPYCQRRCTYCNFNKYIDSNVDHTKMQQCLVREVQTLIDMSGIKRIKSVFFGGGTPSLAKPQTLQAVLDTVAGVVDLPSNAEVTMEGNPTSVGRYKLRDFKHAGINRVSLGIQALNDDDLNVLGRDHSTTESMHSIKEAQKLFPGRVSLDLIFGRPGQTLPSWEQELQQVLTLCDNHVSLYQLTLERGTELFKMHAKGEVALPADDDVADMYIMAVDMMEEQGLRRYEVSNFAREGSECLHNQAYWEGGQYIGIGPGAHGRFMLQKATSRSGKSEVKQGNFETLREARIQTLEPGPWMFEVLKYGHGTRKRVCQTQLDVLQELLLVGMRTSRGVTSKRWAELSGGCLSEVFCDDNVQRLVQDGLIVKDRTGLRATPHGMVLLDSIIPHLILTLQEWYTGFLNLD